jgi:hypothetical protein
MAGIMLYQQQMPISTRIIPIIEVKKKKYFYFFSKTIVLIKTFFVCLHSNSTTPRDGAVGSSLGS